MATLVNSGDFVRSLSNNDAACYDYLYWLLGLNLLDPAGCSELFGLSIVLSVCVRACVRACEILTRLTNAGGSTSWLPHIWVALRSGFENRSEMVAAGVFLFRPGNFTQRDFSNN